MGIWQGTVGRAEGDKGWQRPAGGLGYKGTAAGGDSCKEAGERAGQNQVSHVQAVRIPRIACQQGYWTQRPAAEGLRGKGVPWA